MAQGSAVVHTLVAENRLEILQVCRLLQCVNDGDKPQIEKMVRLGVPRLISITEPMEGNGAMHLASVANDTDMVRFLISLGANPNVQDKKGRTPVILAAQLGHDNMMALLAMNDANMNVVDNEGQGVLFYCISPTKRHQRCLQVALKGKANVNNVSSSGKPVFLLACEHAQDCESMCLSILERGADPTATDEATGRTALMGAAKAGALDLVRAILLRGANSDALDKNRMHAAHMAAQGGFFEVLVLLSAYSADLSVVDKDGNTPLSYAAAGGFSDCCRFLSQRGCNSKLKNVEGLIPRQMAKDKVTIKELKKAERLQGKLSKPGAVNPNEPWALTLHDWSCEYESALRSAMEILEEVPSAVDTVSKETFVTVLSEHRAPVQEENLQKIIMEHDKKREGLIHITDFFKGVRYLQKPFTLPSYAPKKKKAGKGGKGKKKGQFVLPVPICVLPPELIFRRQDGGPPTFMVESYQQFTDAKRFDRDHPPAHPIEDDSAWYIDEPEKIYININYCVKTGDLESLGLAFSQRVPVDVKDRFYKTPLMAACGTGNIEVARFLLGLGADVNAVDQFDWTPLHHACHGGQVDIIDLLVQSGAAVDALAMNGATPLMRAIETCRPCCVDYLIKAGAKVQAENKKEQNCLDIARAYGDARIVEIVQTKFDTLPKSKEKKGAKGGKPAPKAKSTKQKLDGQSPSSSDTGLKVMSMRESIVRLNNLITSGATKRQDIRFLPKTVWGNQLTSCQMIERKEERRDRFSYEVDFEEFMMPFNKNITQKAQELGGAH
ncbi:ankyrin repeat and EF-hand domain-containing protein 1 [Aplochiton taeniatus]